MTPGARRGISMCSDWMLRFSFINVINIRKSLRTLQNKVRINVVLIEFILFVNVFMAFKKCIVQ